MKDTKADDAQDEIPVAIDTPEPPAPTTADNIQEATHEEATTVPPSTAGDSAVSVSTETETTETEVVAATEVSSILFLTRRKSLMRMTRLAF